MELYRSFVVIHKYLLQISNKLDDSCKRCHQKTDRLTFLVQQQSPINILVIIMKFIIKWKRTSSKCTLKLDLLSYPSISYHIQIFSNALYKNYKANNRWNIYICSYYKKIKWFLQSLLWERFKKWPNNNLTSIMSCCKHFAILI